MADIDTTPEYLRVLDHPVIDDHMATLRSATTSPADFRASLASVATLVIADALASWPTEPVDVRTPLASTTGRRLLRPVTVVGILRAALPMVDAALLLIPDAGVGFLGLARDEATHRPSEYYVKLPPTIDGAAVLVVDPMLATGGSAVHAIEVLRRHGARPVGFAGIIGCAQGVDALHDADPELRITLAALDPGLDENAYIVPGLGDAGDRTFAT